MKCPCCDLAIAKVEDIEPVFGLPDRIRAVHPSLCARLGSPGRVRERATALLSADVCVLRGTPDTEPVYYLRVVVPVPVIGRPGRPCNWGAWAELPVAVITACALQGTDSAVALEPSYAGRLANDIGLRVGQAPLLGAAVTVEPQDDVTRRWTATLADDVDHPFADDQRQGVTRERVAEWTRPWHHRVAN